MTATRVVTDHEELDNVGSVTHPQIDSYINTSPFLLVSGAAGAVPASSRRLAAGAGISIVDGGPGGTLTISSTGGGGGGTTRTAWMEIPSGSVDGVNTDFTLTNTPSPLSALMFYVNGVLQKQGSDGDYIMQSSTVVRMLSSYASGSNLAATYPYVVTSSVGSSTSWMEIPSGSVDGVNTDFTINNVPSPLSALMFYVDGVLQRQGSDSDYIMVGGGTTIRMVSPYKSGSNLAATYPY